jgi:apolipoprotein N-acyltransferase
LLQVLLPGLLTALLVTLSAPGYAHGRAQAFLQTLSGWVAFVPLLWVLPTLCPRQAALAGLLAGTASYLGWAAWMPGLMARYSGWSPMLAVLAAVALAFGHGLGWSLWSYWVRKAADRWPLALVAPAGFVVMECWFPTVFPWSLGLAQYQDRDLAQVAELGGPCVLSFLEVFAAATVVQAWLAWRKNGRLAWRGPVLLLLVLLASFGFGRVRRLQIESIRSTAPGVRIAAVQAGTAMSGWRAQVAPNLLEPYRKATKALELASGAFDLVLWPEKASPTLRKDSVHDYPLGHTRRIGDDFKSPLLFGVEALDVDTRERWNAAALLLPDRRLQVVYSKVKLIPWSEWLPAWAEPLWGRRYRPGATVEPVLVPALRMPGERAFSVGTFICFEAGFPAHVRELVARGAELLINLSDDSWFGSGAEAEQHLAHAVFRAIETRRDLVRATGAGISAFITATGQVERSLPLSRSGDPSVLTAEPRRLRIDSLHRRLGNAFALGCAALVILGTFAVFRARRSGKADL